jgi:hypothetical protein
VYQKSKVLNKQQQKKHPSKILLNQNSRKVRSNLITLKAAGAKAERTRRRGQFELHIGVNKETTEKVNGKSFVTF